MFVLPCTKAPQRVTYILRVHSNVIERLFRCLESSKAHRSAPRRRAASRARAVNQALPESSPGQAPAETQAYGRDRE